MINVIKKILYIIFVWMVSLPVCLAAEPATPQATEIVSSQKSKLCATPRKLSFAWGAEIGGNVDMSGHGMSAVDINAEFGIRWRWIRFFGIGAEGDIMLLNSGRVFPIFANFRTDFSEYNRLLFADVRAGVALNYLYGAQNTGAYFSAGAGITLAQSSTFSSHIILAYSFMGQERCIDGSYIRKCPGISTATLRLGIAF